MKFELDVTELQKLVATGFVKIDLALEELTKKVEALQGQPVSPSAEIEEAVTEKVEEPKKEEAPKKATEPEITIDDVRKAFFAKNSAANRPKLKAILEQYGVAKVPDLPEESFSDVLQQLEAI